VRDSIKVFRYDGDELTWLLESNALVSDPALI
jgi:hypothetical protein